ncbi:hypothetical protein CC79DRAFT_1368842 [Sarocladium strictum]
MSWMDSWSRPGKSQAVPPPYYLTNPQTKYCHTCGRIISERKSHKAAEASATPPKYCSSRCRGLKPRSKDRKVEAAFAALLDEKTEFEEEDIPNAVLDARQKPKAKGEKRLTIPCSAVETLIYGDRSDPTKVYGRRKNRASRAIATPDDSDGEGASTRVYHVEDGNEAVPTAFAGKVRPSQHLASVNGSIGGEKGRAEREAETAEDTEKRLEGQKIADEKEAVKRAARRLCIFGIEDEKGERRMCEAVMQGSIVEPSFAKGDWGVRWRE